MTEEEYFRKNYPDYCYGDRLLSPYWDLFQDGTEFGERQSEKKIEELEKENALLKGRNEGFEQQILGLLIKYEEVYRRFPDLKGAMDKAGTILKENAELDCQKNRNKFCYSCANATERCFRKEIGCPCGKYKSYKDENAELKVDNTFYEKACEGATMMYEHLTKAKEIIREYMRFEPMIGTCSFYSEEYEKTKKKAEQLLKEIEK